MRREIGLAVALCDGVISRKTFFSAIPETTLWRNATLLWRCSLFGALLLSSLPAQPLTPLGITGSQSVATSGQGTARLGPNGSVYVGYLWGAYPGTSGSTPTKSYGDTSKNAYYVSRVDATGKTVFTTALGGITFASMHVDLAGNVFVSGNALSAGFYTSPGAYRSSAPQNAWRFVCKLNGTDGSAAYCTYLDFFAGGADSIDQQGNFIAVVGQAQFGGTTPPPSQGSLDAGSGHIYVVKLNPAGSALTYTAAFGGSGADIPSLVSTDSSGNIYVAGFTTSPDFPTTPNAVVRTFAPSNTVSDISFLAKLSADGTSLVFATLGIPGETPALLALDSANEPQVAYSNTNISKSGVRRYSADGSAVLFDSSTYLTSVSGPILGNSVMGIDAAGNTTLLFSVSTIAGSLLNPTGACQFSTAIPSAENGFMVRFDSTGTVRQATYLIRSLSSVFDDITMSSGSITVAAWTPAPLVSNPLPTGVLPQLQILMLGPTPQIQLACIGSSATLLASPLAAGEIVSLFGEGIGPTEPIVGVPEPQYPPGPGSIESYPTGFQYPVTLGATSVTFDGVPAPLLYVSSGQINTVVPFAAKNTTHICVAYFFNAPSCMDAAITTAAPGIFTLPATPGTFAFAAAVNQDGTINSATNPAPRGSIVTIFATGLGPLSSMPADGTLVGLPLLTQSLTMAVSFASTQVHGFPASATIAWAGQAPDEIAGLSQINLVVPNQPSSNELSIVVNVPGQASVGTEAAIWIQ